MMRLHASLLGGLLAAFSFLAPAQQVQVTVPAQTIQVPGPTDIAPLTRRVDALEAAVRALQTSAPPKPVDPPPTEAPSTGYGTPERPFAATSPWNTPIAATARFVDDARTARLRAGGDIQCNATQWTIPVYRATSSDPLETISVADPSGGRQGRVTLQAPAGAVADVQDDAHLIVISADGKTSHEFWWVRGRVGSRTAWSYVEVPLAGSGVGFNGPGVPGYWSTSVKSYGWGAIRAYGGSGLGGLIRAGELTTDVAPYSALALSIDKSILMHPADGKTFGSAIAVKDDTSMGYSGNVLMGTRFGLPPTFDSSRLSPAARRLAKRLQAYGAYVVDQSTGTRFGTELTQAKADGAACNAIPLAERNLIRDNLRVVQ